MRSELTLTELAKTIEANEKAKRDFVAPTNKLEMMVDFDATKEMLLRVDNEEQSKYHINNIAHEQLSDKLGIPKKYYDRMMVDAPELLVNNVNHWFHGEPKRNLVRTLDGTMRAFLSDRFRPLDNFLVAQAVLPVLLDQGLEIKILSCAITDRRFYIQAVTPKIEGEVRAGDIVQAGLVISNSEVGCGAMSVQEMVYRLSCLNGLITGHSLRRQHVGKRLDSDDSATYDFYSSETVEADNRAFQLKVRDTVKNVFDEGAFAEKVERLRETTENTIDIKKIAGGDFVEDVTSRFGFTKDEGEGVLTRLIQEGDLTQYGLANAVTNLANDAEDYDRAVELEKIGGRVIDLDRSTWLQMAA